MKYKRQQIEFIEIRYLYKKKSNKRWIGEYSVT